MNGFIKGFILMYFFSCYSQAGTLSCWSYRVFNISLNNSDLPRPTPVKGAIYKVHFDAGEQYDAQCDVSMFDFHIVQTLFKAKYGKDYKSAGDGFYVLDDNVEVKSSFYIVNRDYVVVPFLDIGNNNPELVTKTTKYNSGGRGVVNIRIKKTILEGVITIPSFTIYLYSHWDEDGATYDERPLAKIVFKKSTIDVKKLCNVSHVNKTYENINTANFIHADKPAAVGTITVGVKCVDGVDFSDLNLNLFFNGDMSDFATGYFSTNNDGIGVGLMGDNKKMVYGIHPYKFHMGSLNNKDLKFEVIPLINNSKAVRIENPVLSSPKISLTSD